jgi:hypothetical protein
MAPTASIRARSCDTLPPVAGNKLRRTLIASKNSTGRRMARSNLAGLLFAPPVQLRSCECHTRRRTSRTPISRLSPSRQETMISSYGIDIAMTRASASVNVGPPAACRLSSSEAKKQRGSLHLQRSQEKRLSGRCYMDRTTNNHSQPRHPFRHLEQDIPPSPPSHNPGCAFPPGFAEEVRVKQILQRWRRDGVGNH